MFIDKNLEFCDDLLVNNVDTVSTNVIDLGSDTGIGPGSPLWVAITVTVAPTFSDGDETYDVELQSGSSATPTNIVGTCEIPRTAKVGDTFWIGVPAQNERYLRLNFNVGGTTSVITCSAFITSQEPKSWKATDDQP